MTYLLGPVRVDAGPRLPDCAADFPRVGRAVTLRMVPSSARNAAMCHDDDSRPPTPPNPGPVHEHGPLTLLSADGTQVMAYRALPDAPARAGVVILPDIRGLHPYYEQLAIRFAEAGFAAIAIGASSGSMNSETRQPAAARRAIAGARAAA